MWVRLHRQAEGAHRPEPLVRARAGVLGRAAARLLWPQKRASQHDPCDLPRNARLRQPVRTNQRDPPLGRQAFTTSSTDACEVLDHLRWKHSADEDSTSAFPKRALTCERADAGEGAGALFRHHCPRRPGDPASAEVPTDDRNKCEFRVEDARLLHETNNRKMKYKTMLPARVQNTVYLGLNLKKAREAVQRQQPAPGPRVSPARLHPGDARPAPVTRAPRARLSVQELARKHEAYTEMRKTFRESLKAGRKPLTDFKIYCKVAVIKPD